MKKLFIPFVIVALALTGCSTTTAEPKPVVKDGQAQVIPESISLEKLDGYEATFKTEHIFAITGAEKIQSWTVNYSEVDIVSFEASILSYGYQAKPAFMGLKVGKTIVTLTDNDTNKTYKFTLNVTN